MELRASHDRSGLEPGWSDAEEAWLGRLTWAFVALGVGLRLIRYAMNFPLWSDEAYLAVNLIDRGYGDLLRPLDYGQVCPLLFLWVERAVVGMLGFSEPSLRLFPMMCSVASVFLFRYLAGLATRGVPRLLAVAVFAVSFHPIRHAADVKPYSSDLLVAMILLVPAFAWLRAPGRVSWLWGLAVATPFALMTSYPAVFIAGGIGLGLFRPIWRAGRRSAWVPFVAFGLAVAGTTCVAFALVAEGQGQAVMSWMRRYWDRSFPPLDGVGPSLRWLVGTTTGSMLAYPGGGQNGGSTPTFVCLVIAAVVLWRRRQRAELTILLAPFALTLAASVLRRYPYGGEARTMQFVAPAICLMTGMGAAAALRAFPSPTVRKRAFSGVALALAVGAIGVLWSHCRQPYRMLYDKRVRDFARAFWPEQARDAELACVRWDFGIVESWYKKGILNDHTPSFLCNQMIYSPQRRLDGGPRWDRVSASRPLRCVLFHETPPEDPDVVAWLVAMRSHYRLRGRERFDVRVSGPEAAPRIEQVFVYEFEPTGASPGTLPVRTGLLPFAGHDSERIRRR